MSKYVFASANGVEIKHQADSGAYVNLWPKNYFRDYCNEVGYIPELQPTSKPVRAANNTLIGIKGYFVATLASNHASRRSKIYVMKADLSEPPLMSRSDLFHLGYLQIDPFGAYAANSVSQDKYLTEEEFRAAVAKIHSTFQAVFRGVGQYKFYEVDLKLKPGSEPFVLRAIPVPIHLREPALKRLNEFVRQKILEQLPIGYPLSLIHI